MTKVNEFNVPYPDFKLLDVIDPDQFDANNEEIVKKVNEVIVVLNTEKIGQDGDFLGTWHGLTPGEAAEPINGGRLDILEPKVTKLVSDMSDLQYETGKAISKYDTAIADLKRVSKNNEHEIANLNLYTDANNRVKSGYTFGTNFDTEFGMSVDWTKTESTSNLVESQTIIPVASAEGFKVGQEITVYDDVNLERVKIKAISGTSLTLETGLTKAFKLNANVARTMFDNDTNNKWASYGQWQPTKKDKYAFLGSYTFETTTNYSGNTLAVGSYYNFPSSASANYPSNLSTMSFDMDVMIPDLTKVNPSAANNAASVGRSSFSIFGLRNGSVNGFTFGYTLNGEPGEYPYKGMVSVDRFYYLKKSAYTFYFAINNQSSSNGFALLAPEGILKEFLGKHINIKVKVNKGLFVSAPTSSIELYVNGKRIPLEVGTKYGQTTPETPVSSDFVNRINIFHGYYDSSNSNYYYSGYGYMSRFIAYKDFNYGVKLVEYLFNSELTYSGGGNPKYSTDTSGNDYNLYVSVGGANPNYIWGGEMRKIQQIGKDIEVNDMRFVPTKDSKEIGAWVTRSDKLTPVEGVYDGVAMTLSTLETEDQYIGARDESKPADIRITYKKSTDANFPTISKIVGGVM